jgi:hypothetical protein
MRFPGRIAVLLLLAAPISADVLLTMKSGERYTLSEAPRHKNGMVSFTTHDKRYLTVKESEIAREEKIVPPAPKVKVDRTDTKQLGAVAREERAERGIGADVAGDHSAPPKDTEKENPPKKTAHKPHAKTPPPPPAPPPAASDNPSKP